MKRLRQTLTVLVLTVLMSVWAHAAERWDLEVSTFGEKIATTSGPATASLEFHNNSSLTEEQAAAIRRALEAKLHADGITFRQEHEAAAAIRITLSENQRGWLWIAEVRQGTETQVVMLELKQKAATTSAPDMEPLTLQSSLLLTSNDVLLDAQPLHASPEWIGALTTRSVILYEQKGGRWQPLREIPIPMPMIARDPRGRMVPEDDHLFDIYLPGAVCAASGESPEAIALNCIASDDPWPLYSGKPTPGLPGAPLERQRAIYNSARNYFTGALLPGLGHSIAPFYSAAAISSPKSTLWIFAAVDGRVLSFDGTTERTVGGAARNWGSDLAAVHTACGSGMQVLATEGGNGSGSDSIQAFDVAEREATALSAPLKFAGSITALWTRPDGNGATAILHTAQGDYVAYNITAACNQ